MQMMPVQMRPPMRTPMMRPIGPMRGPEEPIADPVRRNPMRPLASPMSFKKGGKVKKTGWAKVHAGETITPAKNPPKGGAANAMGGPKAKVPKTKRAKAKIKKTMGEWKRGSLHSGSKKGPVVKSQKQAVAIAISQARRKA